MLPKPDRADTGLRESLWRMSDSGAGGGYGILKNALPLPAAQHLQIVVVIVKLGVVNVPVFYINNTGNGLIVVIAVGAFYYIPLYTHMCYDWAGTAFAAALAINRFRYIYVAFHISIYAIIIP